MLVDHRESLIMNNSINQVAPMQSHTAAVRVSGLVCCFVLLMPAMPTLAQDDAADLGAVIKVTATRPLSADLALTPRVALHNVRVELPNAVEAAPAACQFGQVVAGRQYRCTLTGTVAAQINALAVAVTGERSGQVPGPDALVRKLFMIPNPDFDKAKLRAQQDQHLQRKGRLSAAPGAAAK